MKLLKIFSLSLLAVVLGTSCSDDDDFNTNSATVKMVESEITWKETANIVSVPMTIEGETNAPVRVTVEVKEEGANPAVSDVNYILTTNTYVFGAGENEGGIELKLVDDRDINENRTFSVRLVSAEGASISSENASTMVTIKDNDANFYEKFNGKWNVSVYDLVSESTLQFACTIVVANEGDEDYNNFMYITDYHADNVPGIVPLHYSFDMQTKKGSLDIVLGFPMFVQGDINLVSAIYPGIMEGVIKGTWNEDFSEIRFDPECIFEGAFVQAGQYLGPYFAHTEIVFSR